MIGYVKGTILSLSPDEALILTPSGVGFELLISAAAYDKLSGKKEGELFSWLQVREDGATLFGFADREEKEMFLKLISVSGVGPKMGIAVLSSMRPSDIAAAIATNDVKRLSAVKGLGKKTAERIILELREKVSAAVSAEGGAPVAEVGVGQGDEDAVVALMTLGFTRQESIKAVSRAKAGGASSVEDVIMAALKGM